MLSVRSVSASVSQDLLNTTFCGILYIMSDHLVEVGYPDAWLDIYSRFAENVRGADVEQLKADNALLFADILPPNGLGTEFFYNTPASVSQLVVALAVAPNDEIQALTSRRNDGATLTEIATTMRDRKVLSGFKLLDLGCGMLPGFAVVAKSLGAEVHTVDGENLPKQHVEQVDSHTVTNLCSPDAIVAVRANSGDGFDYVSDCIIGAVPGHPNWKSPEKEDIRRFGQQLLREGGFQYTAGGALLQKV